MIEIITSPGGIILPALALDLMLGDPVYPLHPVRLCGKLLASQEKILRRMKLNGYGGGIILFILLSVSCLGCVEFIRQIMVAIHPVAEYFWKLYVVWSLLALGDLCKHGKRIAKAIDDDDLPEARNAVGTLVGRDLDKMDKHDCCRAGIESISENLTDGVVSPLLFYLVFGIPGMVIFKVVSTMDSMVGYKSEKYLKFGWCGARLDDAMNYVPARLTWGFVCILAYLLPTFDGVAAFKTGLTKRKLFPGPNSGWSEAAAAGALSLMLIGPVWRNGVLVTDLWIGPQNGTRFPSTMDLRKMLLLSKLTTILITVCATSLLPWIPVLTLFPS